MLYEHLQKHSIDYPTQKQSIQKNSHQVEVIILKLSLQLFHYFISYNSTLPVAYNNKVVTPYFSFPVKIPAIANATSPDANKNVIVKPKIDEFCSPYMRTAAVI